jgi:tetraacyldisaccharide 4'-kinase
LQKHYSFVLQANIIFELLNCRLTGTLSVSRILSLIYILIITIRNFYYDRFPPKALDFPVISVGGIRAGGSGKTPLTDWVINKITQAGKTPVLFSRGYGRISKRTKIVAPQDESSWEKVGDEPMMLKNHHKNLWLVIDGNRKRGEKKLRCFNLKNIVGIMDDGFQHRKFWRNLDIVIITPEDLADMMLPLGRLREPTKSLERAGVIISQEKIESKKNCVVKFCAKEFVNAVSGEKKERFDEEILCFCGIARPERFLRSVDEITRKSNKHLFFNDHHKYSSNDYKILNSASQAELITTEKDFVRLNTKKLENVHKLWYLSYGVEVDYENNEFLKTKIFEVCGVKNE